MKKMKLELDSLEIDTFSTESGQRPSLGTVLARANTTAVTVCVGLCGGYGQTQVAGCGGPTSERCIYPTNSCMETQTYDENTCHCLYPYSDVRVCCDGTLAGAPGAMC